VLWFISLLLSLLSALFSIFMKQWLHTYDRWTEVAHNNLQQGLILRRFYQAGFHSWRIPAIFTALGVLLQVALILFVIGLVVYLWTLQFVVVYSVVSCFAILMIVLSAIVICLPVVYEDCPYKLPVAYVLLKFRIKSTERDWTERDVPIAKKHLHLDDKQPPVDRIIAQTALLLDIAPIQLELAISPSTSNMSDSGDQAPAAKVLVEGRVHELSAQSIVLLSNIVTSLLQGEFKEDDDARLMGLWQITLLHMARAPLALFHAAHYLEKRVKEEKSSDQGRSMSSFSSLAFYHGAVLCLKVICF
jgi:hypothetical protein